MERICNREVSFRLRDEKRGVPPIQHPASRMTPVDDDDDDDEIDEVTIELLSLLEKA